MEPLWTPLTRMLEPVERLVSPAPVEQVLRIRPDSELSDPREAGLLAGDVEAVWQAVVELYRSGLHPALSFCLRRRGKVLLDRSLGYVRNFDRPVRERSDADIATPDTPFNLFSASKAITAMVIHLLDDRGLVHLDDAVAEYIPEFAAHGKGDVTIRHVLTHRAGLPTIPGGRADLDLLSDPEAIIALLCEAKPSSAPGRRLAYHALTGGFIFGEIVRRVTGTTIDRFLREQILDPLGLRHLNYGIVPELRHEVAVHAFTGPPMIAPYTQLVARALGVPMAAAVELSNDPRFLSEPIPSGNIVGTADEACRFYELLRRGGTLDGVEIFHPRTVRRAASEQSYLEADLTLVFPVRYGMGFMLGSRWASPYGLNTERAFGHIGFTNVITWADPERELSAALMTSGKPLITPRALQWLRVMWRIARRFPRSGPSRIG